MKELFNTLSNTSNFFLDKRFIFKKEAPKRTTSQKNEDPMAVDYVKIEEPTKAQLLRQAEAGKLEARIEEKMKLLRRPTNDYRDAMENGAALRLPNKDFIKSARSLIYAIRDTGLETNKQEGISSEVFKEVAKTIKKLPKYKQYVGAYHLMKKSGTAERANQRRLVKEVKNEMMKNASDKLFAYFIKIEMGPVTVEPATAIASKKTTTKPVVATRKTRRTRKQQ